MKIGQQEETRMTKKMFVAAVTALMLVSHFATQGLATGANADRSFDKRLIEYSIVANTFRLEAARSPDAAIARWGSPAFQKAWARDMKLFKDPKYVPLLKDFFITAIIFEGNVQEGSVVAAFYNPWLDGILLVEMRKTSEIKLEDFRIVAGESWRRETVTTGKDLLKLYALKETLLLALARNYSPTANLFSQYYPMQGKGSFLPPEISSRIGLADEELRPIVARMLYRTKMFAALVSAQKNSFLAIAKELSKKLGQGNEEDLRAYLSPKQDATMLKSICMLPAASRQQFGPVYFGEDASAVILGMVNPVNPRWILAAQILKDGKNTRPTRIEIFDLDASGKLLKLRQGQ